MKDDKGFKIKIESILGGQSLLTHFSKSDQYRVALGVDPGLPISDSLTDIYGIMPSGLLRPTTLSALTGSTAGFPLWIITHPKTSSGNANFYVYDSAGSVYTINSNTMDTLTGLGDLNDGGDARGNGAAYNDNYIYFSRSTTIARYGPLDGTPTFTDDYWSTTLSKTALSTVKAFSNFSLNHFLHRHSDGKLYIADVVGNQGTIHYISTTKTTVEGDTDNGSTYNKLAFGYGLYITCMESYGPDLVIALSELNSTTTNKQKNAKIAFWDTTSQNFNSITWVEFPDLIISAMKNVDGVLYVFSGNNAWGNGFRVTKFVGGYTFEEVFYCENGISPLPGAVDGDASRLLFGSITSIPTTAGCVYSLGLQKSKLSPGLFCPLRSVDSSTVYCLKLVNITNGFAFNTPLIGDTFQKIRKLSTTYSDSGDNYFWSQLYKIGQPFKITKIRIPLAQKIATGMILTLKMFTDDGAGTTFTFTTINDTNYHDKKNIVFRSDSNGTAPTGDHNFWIELKWTGSVLCTVNLPITIEGELVDD